MSTSPVTIQTSDQAKAERETVEQNESREVRSGGCCCC